jgi:hypothetical protein
MKKYKKTAANRKAKIDVQVAKLTNNTVIFITAQQA